MDARGELYPLLSSDPHNPYSHDMPYAHDVRLVRATPPPPPPPIPSPPPPTPTASSKSQTSTRPHLSCIHFCSLVAPLHPPPLPYPQGDGGHLSAHVNAHMTNPLTAPLLAYAQPSWPAAMPMQAPRHIGLQP